MRYLALRLQVARMRKLIIPGLIVGVFGILVSPFVPVEWWLIDRWNLYSYFPGPVDRPLVFQMVLSVLLLAASLFVILSTRYGPKDKHWAYGTVGTLIGFW